MFSAEKCLIYLVRNVNTVNFAVWLGYMKHGILKTTFIQSTTQKAKYKKGR